MKAPGLRLFLLLCLLPIASEAQFTITRYRPSRSARCRMRRLQLRKDSDRPA